MRVPQNLKYKRYFKYKYKQKKKFNDTKSILKSDAALFSKEQGSLSPEQLESCRVSIRRKLGRKKKKIKLWIKIFPYTSYTKKSVGMRMGKGKGLRAGWLGPVSVGQNMFELNYIKNVKYIFRLFKAYINSGKKLSVTSQVRFNWY